MAWKVTSVLKMLVSFTSYVFPGRKLPVRIMDTMAFGAILTRFVMAMTRPLT